MKHLGMGEGQIAPATGVVVRRHSPSKTTAPMRRTVEPPYGGSVALRRHFAPLPAILKLLEISRRELASEAQRLIEISSHGARG
jgi:hypothetical protein